MISILILTFRVPHEQVKPGEQDDETQRHHQQLQLPSAGAEHPGIVEDWAGEGGDQVGLALTLDSCSILSSRGDTEEENVLVMHRPIENLKGHTIDTVVIHRVLCFHCSMQVCLFMFWGYHA